MKNPWFRLYAEFASDPKVQSMGETFQRRLIILFCLRCTVDLRELEEEEIRCALRISPREFLKTKNLFIEKGFLQSDFTIINWNKRQFISDDVSQRVQRHREKVKRYRNVTETEMKRPCNKNVTPPDTDTDTDKKHIVAPLNGNLFPKSTPCPFQAIIEYLNIVSKKSFKWTSKTTRSHIQARWNEGHKLEDFKKVINTKCKKWASDPKMIDYIRPETLFGTKFESYLNECAVSNDSRDDYAGTPYANLPRY